MVVTYLGYSVRFLGKMSSKRVRKGLLPLKMLVRQAVCSSNITQVQPCLCNCSTLTNTDYRTQLNECLCLCKSVLLLSWTLAVAVPLVSPRGGKRSELCLSAHGCHQGQSGDHSNHRSGATDGQVWREMTSEVSWPTKLRASGGDLTPTIWLPMRNSNIRIRHIYLRF